MWGGIVTITITDKEREQIRRIYHSDHGHLQVSDRVTPFTIEKKIAQSLVKKDLACYCHMAATKFCMLTNSGIRIATKKG
jgi:hypothetical protein